MNPSSVHDTSNSLRSSGKSGGSASCRKCETPCARLTTPMTRASRFSEPTGKVVEEFTLKMSCRRLLLKYFKDESADGNDLFDRRGMLDRIRMPFDGPAARAQRVARAFGPRELDDGVARAVRHEYRNVAIRGTRVGDHAVRADQVRRQSDQPAKSLSMPNARIQCDGA